MTAETDLQEEAVILNLACGQLGNDLAQFGAQFAQGRLGALDEVHNKFPNLVGDFQKQLSALKRRYERMQAQIAEQAQNRADTTGT